VTREVARQVLATELEAIRRVLESLDEKFDRAVDMLTACAGRVVWTGMGKSGIICHKLAATMRSTGTPALHLHPADAIHGDLGMLTRDDLVVAVSNSGATEEILRLVEFLKRQGIPLIAMTSDPRSALAEAADLHLDLGVRREACPLNLAPTASTTASLALGDALAMEVAVRKGFDEEDFARLHPGGSLGRKLTLRVEEVMVGEDYPSLGESALIRDCIVPLAKMRGTVPIVDEDGTVVGVVTAGDLTRLMGSTTDFLDVPVRDVMTRTPKLARLGELASAAVHVMEKHGIMALPVVDESNRLRGIVHLHDLMRSGAV